MKTIDYDSLDPGIRKLVRLLNEYGFDTVDSGDGKTKQANGYENAEDEPHVYIKVDIDRNNLVEQAQKLYRFMELIVKPEVFHGTMVEETTNQEMPILLVEASYIPRGHVAILSIRGVSDEDLNPGVFVKGKTVVRPD